MSLTDITTRVSIVAVLALVALVVIGWRKPAKAGLRTPRGPGETSSGSGSDADGPVDLQEKAARKTLDVLGLGGVALVAGVVVSIVLSVSVAWLVTTFVSRL